MSILPALPERERSILGGALDLFTPDQMHAYARAAMEQAGTAPSAVVYPPDGTVSPFTVINLGAGAVQMGDSIHDHRLPALWFGKNGQGMGHEEVMNREAREGETLAVITFANVEGLDVLASVIQRIRRVSFPSAVADNLRDTLQRKCTDIGLYWRASDAHGVDCTVEQAADLLAQALGVEVNIALSAASRHRSITAAATTPAPRCPHCDDTGDVHGLDGEWRGRCACPAGQAGSR